MEIFSEYFVGRIKILKRSQRGNEPSGPIKCREFFDWLRKYQLLQKQSAPRSQFIKLLITLKEGQTCLTFSGPRIVT
jgi:hypothetical protein